MISPDRSVELLPDLIVRVIGAVEGEAKLCQKGRGGIGGGMMLGGLCEKEKGGGRRTGMGWGRARR